MHVGLVLVAAGLLRGYQAIAHWGVADLLPIMRAIRSHECVVHERVVAVAGNADELSAGRLAQARSHVFGWIARHGRPCSRQLGVWEFVGQPQSYRG